MRMKIAYILILLLSACGCSKSKPSPYAQGYTNVVEGVGIPGALEIGMRLDTIPQKFSDASCEPNSRASLLWWFGETWRKHAPWQKPATYELTVPSVGAVVYERTPTNAIQQIHFKAKKDYDWPYFSGTLSSGLSFSATSTVSLAEVIARYGNPLNTLTYPSTTTPSFTNGMQFIKRQEAILASGESLLMTYTNGYPYRLHYPARGIYFDIQNGEVASFRIFKRVEQAESTVPVKAAPSASSPVR